MARADNVAGVGMGRTCISKHAVNPSPEDIVGQFRRHSVVTGPGSGIKVSGVGCSWTQISGEGVSGLR